MNIQNNDMSKSHSELNSFSFEPEQPTAASIFNNNKERENRPFGCPPMPFRSTLVNTDPCFSFGPSNDTYYKQRQIEQRVEYNENFKKMISNKIVELEARVLELEEIKNKEVHNITKWNLLERLSYELDKYHKTNSKLVNIAVVDGKTTLFANISFGGGLMYQMPILNWVEYILRAGLEVESPAQQSDPNLKCMIQSDCKISIIEL
jgi:hypothetical protein